MENSYKKELELLEDIEKLKLTTKLSPEEVFTLRIIGLAELLGQDYKTMKQYFIDRGGF